MKIRKALEKTWDYLAPEIADKFKGLIVLWWLIENVSFLSELFSSWVRGKVTHGLSLIIEMQNWNKCIIDPVVSFVSSAGKHIYNYLISRYILP